jgi:hypothetical protein
MSLALRATKALSGTASALIAIRIADDGRHA